MLQNEICHYIYLTTDMINNIGYIGRRSCYCAIEDDPYLGSGILLKMAINKYGVANFKKEILYICNSFDELCIKEKELIKEYNAVNSYKYYNIDCGGYSKSIVTMSDRQRRKFNYMKKIINNSVKYFLKLDLNGTYSDNPSVGVAMLKYDKNGNPVATYSTGFNNVNNKNSSIIESVACQIKELVLDKNRPVDEWFLTKGYEEIDSNTYNQLCNCLNDASKIVIKTFDIAETIYNNKNPTNNSNVVCKKSKKMDRQPSNNSIDGKDFITYFRQLAVTSKDFKNLLKLIEEFAEYGIERTVVFHAITGSGSIQVASLNSFKCSDRQYKEARDALKYSLRFKDIVDKAKGRKSFFYMCLNSCFKNINVNNEELFKKLHKKYKNIQPITHITSLERTMKQINDIYNYGKNTKDKINIVLE